MRQLTSTEVRNMAADDEIYDFFCRLHNRRITLCAYDFFDGCTGYAEIWDAAAEDYEYIDSVDLSCLSTLDVKE